MSSSPRRFLPVVWSLLLLLVATSALANGRYLVKFKKFEGSAEAVRAQGGTPIYEFSNLSTVAAYLPEQAIQGLRNNPNVEFIEEDPKRELFAQTTPYGIPMVQADQVSFNSGNAASCKVCIIDSGYFMSHEDLQDSNVTWDTDSGSGDPLVDGCGHGTHVAGTIAALNNTLGVIGVVPNGGIQLHIIKVFGNDCAWAYSSDLINALNKCRNAGAKVVSMSLGGTFSSTTEKNAFDQAWSAGVLSIAAAGNGGNNKKSYPASYTSVVSVAAVDSNKTVATFSQFNNEVDIAAPGVSVLSTVPWKSSTVTSASGTYNGSDIDGSARIDATGTLVDGGLCGSAGSWSGKVVLCERGTYSFADKVNNVKTGGGVAAVIYNNVSGGFAGTLNGTSTIPAISISQEDGLVVKNDVNFSATVSNTTGSGSGYEAWDGTSMATPHVSGVASLVWSNFPTKSNADIRNALEATAQDLGAAGRDDYYGWGLVQARAAYDLLAGSSTGDTTAPTTSITSPAAGATVSGTVLVTASASDNVGVTKVEFYLDGVLQASDTSSPYEWSWDTTTATNASHSLSSKAYDAAGNVGSSASVSVTVSNSTSGSITLTATGYKVKGVQKADLTWTGATTTNVDVYRNGALIITTANDGFHTDNINKKGGGSYTYKVCNAGSTTCSSEVTVSF
ncbi:MAG TPA: S8 family serine peptidase [Thermoanaerobaculia bacterium]|nr:S8 family serine peptidase [Thermoanaerobaculia bacterium]